MPQKESIILFGEGKADAVFLGHLCVMYREELRGTRIKIDAGRGGSPKQIITDLIRRHLELASYDRALLFLDGDLGRDQIPAKWLRDRPIKILESEPVCLEGMLLKLLDCKITKSDLNSAARLKRKFRKEYLRTDRDSEIVRKLQAACPQLYPRDLLDEKRATNSTLDGILTFLKL